jgi:hypothetical protein
MIKIFDVVALPDIPIAQEIVLEALGGKPFCIIYDFAQRRCMVASDDDGIASRLPGILPGLSFGKEMYEQIRFDGDALSLYRSPESIGNSFISDIFDFGINEGYLAVFFSKESHEKIEPRMRHIERRLGEISRNIGYSISDMGFGKRINRSVQGKDFASSSEEALLTEMLESLNLSLLRNGYAYRILFIATSKAIREYISMKMLLIESHSFSGSIDDAFRHLDSIGTAPFSSDLAARLICLRGTHSIRHVIHTAEPLYDGDVDLGIFMKDAVHDSGRVVRIGKSVMNLGTIISGLPGSGKTRAAMSILDSLLKTTRPKMLIISPTDEWRGFALSHGMNLIKLCDGSTPINFFRCPDETPVSSFYESLAMILASAAAAGPYRNPIEKCLLNAFRKVYSNTQDPDPADVFHEISESIIKMHGKRTNVGVKYTKHGENIKASLENLKSVLSMPEYSSRNGLHLEEIIGTGVVFDISGAGAGTREHLYALILNLAYSAASMFDSNGEGELRLVICLEEAQMLLKDSRSSVVEDMKYRIQDFRKKGIGLMLLAHNITDIDKSIRRLCQIKLYLKQAPDVAEDAARDLVFTNVESDAVVSKLKHLDSRIGALSYVSKDNGIKMSPDTVFVKTMEYDALECQNSASTNATGNSFSVPKEELCKINVADCTERPSGIRISFLEEDVAIFWLESLPAVVRQKMIIGARYSIEMLDQKGRTIKKIAVRARRNIRV